MHPVKGSRLPRAVRWTSGESAATEAPSWGKVACLRMFMIYFVGQG